MEFWCLSGSSIYYPNVDLAIEKIRIFLFARKAKRITIHPKNTPCQTPQ